MARRDTDCGGWTLAEVTLVVAMIAVVAVVAIPEISERIDRSRTGDAIDNIDRLVRASAVYVSTPLVDPSGLALPCQFPAPAASAPAESCCDDGDECAVVPGAWDAPTWKALDFAVTEPHLFVYAYDSTGTLANARFVARAHGDMDCDGTRSTFARSGNAVVMAGKDRCTLRLSPSFTITDRLE